MRDSVQAIVDSALARGLHAYVDVNGSAVIVGHRAKAQPWDWLDRAGDAVAVLCFLALILYAIARGSE